MILSTLLLGWGVWEGSKKVTAKVVELTDTIKPMVKPASYALCATAFVQAAAGLCAPISTFSGIAAQKALLSIFRSVAKDISEMKTHLEAMSRSLDIMVNFQNQQHFAQHVYDLVKMRTDEEAKANRPPAYFFVYHRGNEWRPRFTALVDSQPLERLCGIFDNLDLLAAFLIELRKHVERDAVFHILVPVTELFYVPDPMAIPAEIGPVVIEGELHNQTGMPYVFVNIPDAPSTLLRNIQNVAQPNGKGSGWRKWCASTSAAWAVALPAAVVATPGGLLVGVACGMVATAACPPLLGPVAFNMTLNVGAVLGSLGASTGVGTMTGLFVGKKVDEAWERKYGDGAGTLTGICLGEKVKRAWNS